MKNIKIQVVLGRTQVFADLKKFHQFWKKNVHTLKKFTDFQKGSLKNVAKKLE